MCKLHLEIDQARAESFAENLLQSYNMGSLSLMISIGHRTGLFDTLSNLPKSTSEEISEASGLNERYVREWLNTLVTARMLEYDNKNQKYSLPREHAAFLTREAGADNMASFAQYIAVLGSVEDKIVDCFYNGGGVPYEEYERFHEVMAEDSGQSVLPVLLDQTLPLAPGIVDRLEEGITVLDIGCGKGKAVNLMAQHFPNSEFYGYDLCLEPLEDAKKEAENLGLTNVFFEQQDLTHFRHIRQYDFITAFDAIHDQARPDLVLKSIFDALKPGGDFLMQDIDGSTFVENNLDHPLGTLLYTISCMHCMTVSLAQNGMGLGTMWGEEQAVKMLKEAGFSDIQVKRLDHDIQNCYYILKKSL